MKEAILHRLRRATSGMSQAGHPGPLPPEARTENTTLELFANRAQQNGIELVTLDTREATDDWFSSFLDPFESASSSAKLPTELAPKLAQAPAAATPLGVSLALAAAAETGTVILSSAEGRRNQLLPPTHLVWLRAETVYGTLGETLEILLRAGHLPAALGLHSGPSRSADIGQIMVQGIHGPGRLVVALLMPGI